MNLPGISNIQTIVLKILYLYGNIQPHVKPLEDYAYSKPVSVLS